MNAFRKSLMTLSFATVIVAAAQPAQADHEADYDEVLGLAFGAPLAMVGSALSVTSIPALIRGGSIGERPRGAWRALGWIGGALSIAGGVVLLATNRDSREWSYLGAGSITTGALALGFNIWASTQPESSLISSLAVAPIAAAPSNQPGASYGLAVAATF